MSTEDFDTQVKAVVDSGKLSTAKVKSITDLALANTENDSHLVSTLFRIHKKAKPANKIWSFYVIDAISREMKSHAKKSKGKEASGKGSSASFLQKMEICLDRIVTENLEKGLPEHREKVKKVLGIWTNSSTFRADTLTPLTAKVNAAQGGATLTKPSGDVNKASSSQVTPNSLLAPASSAAPLSQDLLAVLTGGNKPASSSTPPPPVSIAPDLAQILASALNPSSASALSLPAASTPIPPPAPAATDINALLAQLASSATPNTLASSQPADSGRRSPPPGRFEDLRRPSRGYDNRDSRSPPRRNDYDERPRRRFDSPPADNLRNSRGRQFSPDYNTGDRSPPRKRQRSRSPPPPADRYTKPQSDSGWGRRLQIQQEEEPPQQPQPKAITADGPSFLDQSNLAAGPDFSSFDAYDPQSWEKFARTWLIMYQFLPNNAQVMMMVNQTMMMQAASGMSGGFNSSEGFEDQAATGGSGGMSNSPWEENNASAPSAPVPETGGKKRGRMMRQEDGSFKFVMGAE